MYVKKIGHTFGRGSYNENIFWLMNTENLEEGFHVYLVAEIEYIYCVSKMILSLKSALVQN